jgi:NCS1 family nucleobase:cation symporter-1
VFLKFWPSMASLQNHHFAGLSALGYISYAILWVAQGAVFWRGMEAIRRFIDWAGPAVYVVMIVLAVYLVSKAGWSHISLNLSTGRGLDPLHTFYTTINAVALVVAYCAGPMLNFGDFARYGRSFAAVKRGNLIGLPVNYLFFSIITVITASATVPVYGALITDPIQTVQRINTTFAILLGGLTFVAATVGINIVANFIAPAFDFSNIRPQRISWRMGGMIAAVGSVLLTPWNWYNNARAIDYTLGLLGALIGPLFGILIAGYYVVSRQRVWVDDLYTRSPGGRYWFRNGYNPNAIWAVVLAGVPAIGSVLIPTAFGSLKIGWLSDYSWFIGCGLGFLAFVWLERRRPVITDLDREVELAADGAA